MALAHAPDHLYQQKRPPDRISPGGQNPPLGEPLGNETGFSIGKQCPLVFINTTGNNRAKENQFLLKTERKTLHLVVKEISLLLECVAESCQGYPGCF